VSGCRLLGVDELRQGRPCTLDSWLQSRNNIEKATDLAKFYLFTKRMFIINQQHWQQCFVLNKRLFFAVVFVFTTTEMYGKRIIKNFYNVQTLFYFQLAQNMPKIRFHFS